MVSTKTLKILDGILAQDPDKPELLGENGRVLGEKILNDYVRNILNQCNFQAY